MKDQTTTLSIAEARELLVELNGGKKEFGNPHEYTGLLNSPTSARLKFRLYGLVKQVSEKVEDAEKTRVSIVNKYGKEDEKGNKSVQVFELDKKGKPTQKKTEAYTKFLKEYNELMQEKFEINFEKIDSSELDFKTDDFYYIVFEKLVK